jgi:hypothetical protein
MDVVSHGFWGYGSLRWKGKKAAWAGFAAGVAPDLLFFIPSRIERIMENGWAAALSGPPRDPAIWKADGPPMPLEFLETYHRYYTKTHNLVIVALVVALLFLFKRPKWAWLAVPYSLHILFDLPTHERFTTPIFYPLSDWTFVGWSWGNPWIFFPNWFAVIAFVCWMEWRYRDPSRLAEG